MGASPGVLPLMMIQLASHMEKIVHHE